MDLIHLSTQIPDLLHQILLEAQSDITKSGITLLLNGFLKEPIEEFGRYTRKGLKNIATSIGNIKKKFDDRGEDIEEKVKNIEIDAETIQPILEGVSITRLSKIITEKWTNLLESAILGNTIHPIYIETLKLIDGVDANILEIIFVRKVTSTRISNIDLIMVLKDRGIEVKDENVIESLFNLYSRGLFTVNVLQGQPTHQDMHLEENNIYVSDFGIKFLCLVNGINNSQDLFDTLTKNV